MVLLDKEDAYDIRTDTRRTESRTTQDKRGVLLAPCTLGRSSVKDKDKETPETRDGDRRQCSQWNTKDGQERMQHKAE